MAASGVCTDDAAAVVYGDGDGVEGWLTPTAAQITIELARAVSVRGRPVCEIGVHHGKFAILLALLAGARLVGFDLFERQAENEDDSGAGDQRIFRRNAIAHGIQADNIVAVSMNSLELTPNKVIEDCGGRPVLFSIDGGHTEELTWNDLRIAADAVADDGIVILDDVFHQGFPGVVSGLFAFMAERPDALFPVCIGGGKLFLAKSEPNAQRLQVALGMPRCQKNGLGQMRIRRFCGRDVLVVRPVPAKQSVRQTVTQTEAWGRIRKTSAGIALRRAFAVLRYGVRVLHKPARWAKGEGAAAEQGLGEALEKAS